MVDSVNDAPRTRRMLLTAAAAAGAAAVANAVVRPLPTFAGVDDNADMFVGTVYGDVSLTTGLVNNTTGTTVFSATSGFGTAVRGQSSSGSGGSGVAGVATGGSAGIGVRGSGGAGRGVIGESTSFTGVHAISSSGTALRAESSSGYGVDCSSGSNLALRAVSNSNVGAYVYSGATDQPAVQAVAGGGSTAVHGHAGTGSPATEASTGVQGTAAGSGTGGYFSSPSGNALHVRGKASFSRAGRASIPRNRSYVDVSVAGGLASTAFVVATLQAHRAGVYVTSVRVNYPSAGKARIQLNKVASTSRTTPVGFFVLG